MTTIGRLQAVSPREAWLDEARDFTPWLAEHLGELGEVIGIRLEFEEKEVSVDTFSADIIARDPTNDARILIENQLEKSDHRHLGQIMTYLAGLEAQVIVWIAIDFTEPHLAAIKWLNQHTVEPYAFFAVKLRVVRIGDSPLAPVFDVLERPNNWERHLQAATREKLSHAGRGEDRTAFWSMFIERYPELAARGITANGSASKWLVPDRCTDKVLSIYMARNGVGVFVRGLRGTAPAEIFAQFEPMHEQFAKLVGGEIRNGSVDNHPGFYVTIDMDKRENWPTAIDWLAQKADLWLAAIDELFSEKSLP